VLHGGYAALICTSSNVRQPGCLGWTMANYKNPANLPPTTILQHFRASCTLIPKGSPIFGNYIVWFRLRLTMRMPTNLLYTQPVIQPKCQMHCWARGITKVGSNSVAISDDFIQAIGINEFIWSEVAGTISLYKH
jgi:hypothetical protein